MPDLDDTTEAFGETDFGGFFDSVLGKATPKKKIEAKVAADLKAKGATSAQLSLLSQAQAKSKVTPAALGKGLVQTAKFGAALAAFVVPGGAVAGTAALGGLVAADKLVAAGEKGVKAAHDVIDTTKKLAAEGKADAQRGLQVIGMAASLRAQAAAPKGTPQPTNAVGTAAYTQFLAQRRPVVLAAKPAPKPIPLSFAPQSGTTRVQLDWLVHDSGRVERVPRGAAVNARGWLVGPNGLRRIE